MSPARLDSKRLASAKAFAFATVCTFIFFFPSLEHNSRTAGFLYTGDVLGQYWPTTMKMQRLISSFQLNAVDLSIFGGSSDFYATPNQFGVHPLFVVYSLLSGATHPDHEAIGHVLVAILAIQCFFGCYFAIRLGQRFVGLSFGAAAFASVIFMFSFGMVSGLGEPEMLFSWSVYPWCVYAALRFQERPSLLGLPWAMFPTVLMLLGGYVPEGVATLFLTTLTIIYLTLVNAPFERLSHRLWSVGLAFVPQILAVLVVSPYLLEVLRHLHASPSAHTASLFYSAHQLSELPQTVLRMFSTTFAVPGPLYEETVSWGLIGAYIAFMFLLRPSAARSLSPQEWTTLKLSFALYAVTVLAIYGSYTPVSDMVFHFVPQVGGMHIYQRFLLPAGLALGVSLALMLTALLRIEMDVPGRIGAALCLVLTFFVAFQVAFHGEVMAKLGIGNATVFELLLLTLFACALIVPGQGFKLACAIFLAALPILNMMYNFERLGNDLSVRRSQQPIMLDPATQAGIVGYMRGRSSKQLIKYMDLTPMWVNGVEPFPKSFPYLVEKDIKLSSYTGFNFYLTPPADYMQMMPIQGPDQMKPDWSYVRRTGAEFVVALNQDMPALVLAGLVRDTTQDVLQLPGGVSLARLLPDGEQGSPIFDNGYFRVDYADQLRPDMHNIAVGKSARESSEFGDAAASRAVDGRTDGDLQAASLSHTQADPNAWLDVDLGVAQPIDAVRLWNRTDCCGERLSKFWILISNEPFSDTDTAASAHVRPGVWSRFVLSAGPQLTVKTMGASGRYVRVQFDGEPGEGRYLSLAELQVLRQPAPPAHEAKPVKPIATGFKTNGGSLFRLDVNAPSGAAVTYEFWNNKGLRYFVDGRAVRPVNQGGATVIPVGPGQHRIEVRYRNYLQTLFWIVYLGYLAVVLATSALWAVRRIRPGPAGRRATGVNCSPARNIALRVE